MRQHGRTTRCGKKPRFDERACPERFREASEARKSGWNLADAVCRRPQRCRRYHKTCPWWKGKEAAKHNDILMAASTEINVPEFWSDSCEGRDLIIVDEAAFQCFRQKIEVSDERMQKLLDALTLARERTRGEEATPGALALRSLVRRIAGLEELARQVTALHETSVAPPRDYRPPNEYGYPSAEGVLVPPQWTPEVEASFRSLLRLASVSGSTQHEMLATLRDLSKTYRSADNKVTVVPVVDSWRLWSHNLLPRDKTIILLDATTDPRLLKEEFGDRLVVHAFEKPVRPKARVVQVMDSLWSGVEVRSAVTKEGTKRDALLPVINHITQKLHPKAKRIGLIGHGGKKERGESTDRGDDDTSRMEDLAKLMKAGKD